MHIVGLYTQTENYKSSYELVGLFMYIVKMNKDAVLFSLCRPTFSAMD